MKYFALALVFVLSGCATEPQRAADKAIAADAVSTAAALANGAMETNPLGWFTVPVRVMIVEASKGMPQDEARRYLDAVAAGGWGATANNLLVVAGAAPVAPAAGLAVGWLLWRRGRDQRERLRLCMIHQKLNPQLKDCNFAKEIHP